MKPLPVAPLTLEDMLIWEHCRWSMAGWPWTSLMTMSELSDRRDAKLMLYAQWFPELTIVGTRDTGTRIEVRGVHPGEVRLWNPAVPRDFGD